MVPEMIVKTDSRSWQCHPSLDRLDFLSETGKVDYTFFHKNIAEMTLKVNQSHWQ